MTMTPAGETYRRLPGRRRSLWSGASLWMGSDHLLLVRSAWFREEYKRFYLRDIQAIVVAPCARFHVSTPVFAVAVLWLLLSLVAFAPVVSFGTEWAYGTLVLVAAWLAVSAAAGCRCRLYTAVSHDELPSLYRTWTARRFLKQVQPWIEQVQGTVDPGWVEAERSEAGPALAPLAPADPPPRAGLRSHTLASDLLVLSLFVGALVDWSTIHARMAIWSRVNTGLTLAQLAAAIAVIVQHYRGTLRHAMQKLAIAALALLGVMFYVQAISFSFANNFTAIGPNRAAIAVPPVLAIVHRAADGLGLLLSFIGAAIILRDGARGQPDNIKS